MLLGPLLSFASDTHWRGWSIYLVSKAGRQKAFGNMQIDTTKVYDFLIALAVSLAAIELSIIGSFLIARWHTVVST